MSTVMDFFSKMKLTDAIDIIIVAYIIYKLIRIVSGTKAAQIIKGIAFLLVITLVSDIFRLNTLNYILRNTIQVGLIALIILFQPELRKALENVGRNMFGNLIKSNDVDNADKTAETINQVCRAVHSLSAKKTGAIIVFERETNLEELLIGK